jgi:hypothetical protein
VAGEDYYRRSELLEILKRAGVESYVTKAVASTTVNIPEGATVIPMSQPYGAFAKALLEKQSYPDLLDSGGHPIAPYDVTAHTLPLLMDVSVNPVYGLFSVLKTGGRGAGRGCGSSRGDGPAPQLPENVLFRSSVPSMDEGWTRWIFEQQLERDCSTWVETTTSKAIRSGNFANRTVIFPDQPANQILNGYAPGTMPDEYVGGVGKEGVENLKKFVEAGGTLVFLNRSSEFAIREFNLPVKDVTRGLARKDFYIPGSILRTELDTTHPIAKGMPQQSIAWFENSPAFDVQSSPPCLGGVWLQPGGGS